MIRSGRMIDYARAGGFILFSFVLRGIELTSVPCIVLTLHCFPW
jgi:hypothetical protein